MELDHLFITSNHNDIVVNVIDNMQNNKIFSNFYTFSNNLVQ